MQTDEHKEISIKMIEGLLGFEDAREYTLQPVPDNPVFFWLQAENGPGFVLTRPQFFFPDFTVTVQPEDLKELGASPSVSIYLIVTVPERVHDMTANLLAPLFVDEEKGLALQIVMHDSPYTTRHFLFPPERRRDCG
jgi:flagellar assembly factor FliW